MIKSELIKEPYDLYIKYSVKIDVDTLEVVHKKLVNSGYNRIEYRFSAHHSRYTCDNIDDVREVFSVNGLSEISELDIDCRNENYKSINMTFRKGSDYCLKIHSSDSESNELIREIFSILNEKNIHGYKSLANVIVKLRNFKNFWQCQEFCVIRIVDLTPFFQRKIFRLP